uniref:Uncharacterized protein n=1 Tax=Anguilla anguilla TaxID=7936 RepID=A0A0E9WTI1_ANGAN
MYTVCMGNKCQRGRMLFRVFFSQGRTCHSTGNAKLHLFCLCHLQTSSKRRAHFLLHFFKMLHTNLQYCKVWWL